MGVASPHYMKKFECSINHCCADSHAHVCTDTQEGFFHSWHHLWNLTMAVQQMMGVQFNHVFCTTGCQPRQVSQTFCTWISSFAKRDDTLVLLTLVFCKTWVSSLSESALQCQSSAGFFLTLVHVALCLLILLTPTQALKLFLGGKALFHLILN